MLKTNLFVNQRFHLKPLAAVLDGVQHACVVLVDRTKARVFEMVNDEIAEKQDFINELTRRGKSDGWPAMTADTPSAGRPTKPCSTSRSWPIASSNISSAASCDRLLIGCHDDVWPEIHRQLHSNSKQRLVGHFRIDPKVATPDQVKQMATEQLAQYNCRLEAGADQRSDR